MYQNTSVASTNAEIIEYDLNIKRNIIDDSLFTSKKEQITIKKNEETDKEKLEMIRNNKYKQMLSDIVISDDKCKEDLISNNNSEVIYENAYKILGIATACIAELNEDSFKEYRTNAAYYIKTLAENGHVKSMYDYALMVYNGKEFPVDREKAKEYFKKAADEGHIQSMFKYVSIISNEEDNKSNETIGEYNVNNFIEEGIVQKLQNELGNEIENIFSSEAVQNNIDQCRKMVIDLMKYQAIIIKNTKFSKAIFINANNMLIIVNEGQKLFKEDVFIHFRRTAVSYIKMVADEGYHIEATYQYAMMLKFGDGIQTDKKMAANYMKKAADRGNKNAMYSYALMLDFGQGIQIDKKTAMKYYLKAAQEYHVDAMFDYAMKCFLGIGVQRNVRNAIIYYRLAAEYGDQEAKHNFEQITGKKLLIYKTEYGDEEEHEYKLVED